MKKRHSGTFTLPSGTQLDGKLTLDRRRTSLYLRSIDNFSTADIGMKAVTGSLNDLSKVSLLNCIAPPPSHVIKDPERYHYVKIFPHFAVFGDEYIQPDEKIITSANFLIDDATTLFCDFHAFGVIPDGTPFIEQLVKASATGREIPTGPEAQIAYFTGKSEIFAANTIFGRISAAHNLGIRYGCGGAYLKSKIFVTIQFDDEAIFKDAISRTYTIIAYLGMLVGRPQRLKKLSLRLPSSQDRPRILSVYCSRPPTRDRPTRPEKPHSFDVLVDGVSQPKEFSRILEQWLARQSDWHQARWRFFGSFSKQRGYSINRLIGAANLFDILPESAVPAVIELTQELIAARLSARSAFKALPTSPERDSILGALGRMGKSTLMQKVRHRAKILADTAGEWFPDLLLVGDEAINCRNYFVHGGEASFDYDTNFAAVIFFTDSLDFIFAGSDLIEAGWDIVSWIRGGTTMSHPFGSYRVNYALALQNLRSLLTKEIETV